MFILNEFPKDKTLWYFVCYVMEVKNVEKHSLYNLTIIQNGNLKVLGIKKCKTIQTTF